MSDFNAYIAFGANLGDPQRTFASVCDHLEKTVGHILKRSRLYLTKPLTLNGLDSQPSYLNAVIHIITAFPAHRIIALLLETELLFGRDRSSDERWQARVCDLDLLFVDDLVLNEAALTLPHPRLHERDFVLIPLCETAPDLLHPLLKKSVADLLADYIREERPRYVDPADWSSLIKSIFPPAAKP